MGYKSRVIQCDDVGYSSLLELASRRNTPSGISRRAKIIIACVEGKTVQAISQELHVSPSTIMRWKGRFIDKGIDGIYDIPRSGRPGNIDDNFRNAVLKKLGEAPPAGFGQWDGALLSRELGLSKHSIWKLLRRERIRLARKRSWCVSTDPEFASKAADVVGLYLSPPESALALCYR